MTWLGSHFLNVRGFTPDGRIVFTTPAEQPFYRNFRAFTLATDGGLPELMPLGQVDHIAFGPGNARVIGRNTADPARWKRYRGGTAGHLWIDASGSGEFRRMSELTGNITSPMWGGERIYFLSDAQGVGNLYSCLPDGTGLRRHTDHADYYARHAASDGRRIVYQCGAEVWLFDPASDRSQRVAIGVPAHRAQAARKFVAAADNLAGYQPHPEGHSVAIEARGRIFSMPLWEGAPRSHGAALASRQRYAQWLANGNAQGIAPGKTLIAVSDASGEERIVVYPPDESAGAATQPVERTLPWDIGRVIALRAAPVGTRVAIANHRNQVLIGDLASGECVEIDRSDAGRSEDLAWSHDGTWLAYSFWTSSRQCAIKLHDVQQRHSTLATTPDFRDWSPAFDPEGRYLYFLSLRTFDPVYDSVQFELSFPRAARPYVIALRADAKPPFEPEPRSMKSDSNGDKKKTGAGAKGTTAQDAASSTESKPAAPPLQVDLDGITRRVAAFPVSEGRYGQLAALCGKVMWSVMPIAGAHGRGGHKDTAGRIEVFDFATVKAETWLERADSFALANDATTVLIRDGNKLRALDATKKPEDGGAEASRKSGWLDLARVRISVEPRAEWRQMLREVWRLQRDQFWVADMSGVDWPAMLQRYEPLLERVSTRGELADLIWELQGELGTSHAYESGGDHRRPPAVMLGKLGADLKLATDGASYEITRIVQGDPWDADADSPLNAVGVAARVSERIVAINGERVSRAVPPQALLVHQAGAKVELALASASGTRRVLVKTLADDAPARYREWVERNRTWVHEKSGDRVGYLHIPDMMSAGFAEFHRYFGVECDRAGLIVDARYNRGGHVSELLLEKLARKRVGYNLQRWGPPQSYPVESPAGPVVALTNEHAGSDGDIFSHW